MPNSVTAKNVEANPYDFSLVLGGPLYQLMRRSRLSGGALELMWRRVVAMTLLTWLPLFILSFAEGKLWGSSVPVPFLYDVDVNVRFLIALPLLVLAELMVHLRVRPVVGLFLSRELVTVTARAKFDAAIASAVRMRNSVAAEVVLLALVYGVGVIFIWRTHAALEVPNWYGTTVDGKWRPSLAGWWFGLVSLPFFQFLLLRWYFRIFIWARLLWNISRLNLQLVPTHPDRCGGLGFLSDVCSAFAPLILAQGALLTGTIANQIFFAGAKLLQFKIEILAVSAVVVVAVIGPLLSFAPLLNRVKRVGLREYGSFAQLYVSAFDRKWLRGGNSAGETLLGSGDIQSLADLNNSYDVIRTMKLVPFTRDGLIQLVVLALLPVLPLTLTLISMEDLMKQLLKVLF